MDSGIERGQAAQGLDSQHKRGPPRGEPLRGLAPRTAWEEPRSFSARLTVVICSNSDSCVHTLECMSGIGI